jgi:hypothetical protein
MRKSKSRVTKARAICPIRALSIQSIGKTKIQFPSQPFAKGSRMSNSLCPVPNRLNVLERN